MERYEHEWLERDENGKPYDGTACTACRRLYISGRHATECPARLRLALDAALAERDALRKLVGSEHSAAVWEYVCAKQAAEARAERAEALAVKLAEEQDERPGGRVTDHACVECVPDMDEQVRERFRDFRCAYHEARALLAPEAQR